MISKKPQLEDKSSSYQQLLSSFCVLCVALFVFLTTLKGVNRHPTAGGGMTWRRRARGEEKRAEGREGGYSLTEMERGGGRERGDRGDDEKGCWSIIH